MNALHEFNAFVQLCKDGPSVNYEKIKIHKFQIWKADYELYDKDNILHVPKIICKLSALINMANLIEDRKYYGESIKILYDFLELTPFQNNEYVCRIKTARRMDRPCDFSIIGREYLIFYMPDELAPIATILKMKRLDSNIFMVQDPQYV